MKKNENNKLDVVFLLDRSGSMNGSESDTIGGYNSYLQQQRKNNALITTVLFDDNYEMLHFRKDIKEVNDLTKEEYFVRGCTALYDAIGKTIKKLDKVVKDNKVLFVITTDGLENASINFNKEKIKELIKGHTNWEFIYLGANIDSYQEGMSIGIKENNISNYKKSKKGIKNLFGAISEVCEYMYLEQEIGTDWKKDLENNN